MTVQPHQVSRKQGTGARDTIEDEQTGGYWEHKDRRAETETTFMEQDIKMVPSRARQQQFERMLEHQEGMWATGKSTTDRKTRNRSEWRRRMIETFAGYLELSQHQKNRAKYIVLEKFDHLNLGGHYTAEQVILGVISYVAMNEDLRLVDDEERFHELLENEGLTPDDVRTLRGLVRDRL